jgi:hypothetical protein
MTRRGPVIASISIVTLGFGAYIEQRLDFNGANVDVAMFDPRVV